MNIFFRLLVLSSILCLASTTSLSKRGKKQTTAQDILDDQLLDHELKSYDIRNYYDVSSINETLYQATLEKGYSFANGMYTGINLESNEWLNNKQHLIDFEQSMQECKQNTSNARNRMMENDLGISNMVKKATKTRSTWFLYKTALKNLIRHKKPHVQFLEFAANVFIDIDLQKVFEQINSFGMHQIQTTILKTVLVLTGSKRNTKQRKLANPPNEILKLIELMDFVRDISTLNPLSKRFTKNLEVAVETSLMLVKYEIELTDGSSIFDDAVETLSFLQFFKILVPLLSESFKIKLQDITYQVPILKKYYRKYAVAEDNNDCIERISRTLLTTIDDFYGSLKKRFAILSKSHYQ